MTKYKKLWENNLLRVVNLEDLNNSNGTVFVTRFGTINISNVKLSKDGKYYSYDHTILSFSEKLKGVLKVGKDGKVWACYGNPKIPFKKYFYTRLYCLKKPWVPVTLPLKDGLFSNLKSKVDFSSSLLNLRFIKLLITKSQFSIFDENLESYDIVLGTVSDDKKTATVYVIVGNKRFQLFKENISEDKVINFITKINEEIAFDKKIELFLIDNLPVPTRK